MKNSLRHIKASAVRTVLACSIVFGSIIPTQALASGEDFLKSTPIWAGTASQYPQDAADLKRTAGVVFGFTLNDQQYEKIRRWRPKDIDWWLDPAREQAAIAAQVELQRRTLLNTPAAKTSDFNSSTTLFGVAVIVKTNPLSSGGSYRLEINSAKRPDLFSLTEVLKPKVAEWVKQPTKDRMSWYELAVKDDKAINDVVNASTITFSQFDAIMRSFQNDYETRWSTTARNMNRMLTEMQKPSVTQDVRVLREESIVGYEDSMNALSWAWARARANLNRYTVASIGVGDNFARNLVAQYAGTTIQGMAYATTKKSLTGEGEIPSIPDMINIRGIVRINYANNGLALPKYPFEIKTGEGPALLGLDLPTMSFSFDGGWWSIPQLLRAATCNVPTNAVACGAMQSSLTLARSAVVNGGQLSGHVALLNTTPPCLFFASSVANCTFENQLANYGNVMHAEAPYTMVGSWTLLADSVFAGASVTISSPVISGTINISPVTLVPPSIATAVSHSTSGGAARTMCERGAKWDTISEKCVACNAGNKTSTGCETVPVEPEICLDPTRMAANMATGKCACVEPYTVPTYFHAMLVNCRTIEEQTRDSNFESFTAAVKGRRFLLDDFDMECTSVTRQTLLTNEEGEIIFDASGTPRVVVEIKVKCRSQESTSGGSNKIGATYSCFDSTVDNIWTLCPEHPEPNQTPVHPLAEFADTIPYCRLPEQPDWCQFFRNGGTTSVPGIDVSTRSLYISPSTPGYDEDVTVFVEFVNNGTETAPNSDYEVTVVRDTDTRTYRRFVGSLRAGEKRSFEIPGTELGITPTDLSTMPATPGNTNGSFDLTVDLPTWAYDSNPRNNSLEIHWVNTELSPEHDLTVANVSFSPDNPRAGLATEFVIDVKNVGIQPHSSTVRAVVTAPDGTQVLSETYNVPRLNHLQSHRKVFALGELASGEYSVMANIDPSNLIAEGDETNNRRLETYTIGRDETCLPCTSGAPNNQLGAELCFSAASGNPLDGITMQCMGVRSDGTSCASNHSNPNGWENVGSQCPDPSTLLRGSLHPNRCGTPNICPGTR